MDKVKLKSVMGIFSSKINSYEFIQNIILYSLWLNHCWMDSHSDAWEEINYLQSKMPIFNVLITLFVIIYVYFKMKIITFQTPVSKNLLRKFDDREKIILDF